MQITFISLMIFPSMSLHCMLVPLQYQEYDYGLFTTGGNRVMDASYPGGGGGGRNTHGCFRL